MRGSKRRGKRPGTWELRVDAGSDPLSGKRLQRSITFEGTARDADAKLAELLVDTKRGRLPVGSHTVSQLVDAGLEQAASEGLERTTLRGYRRVAENQIRPALGSRRLSKLTAEEIDAFYRALAKKGYSASTLHQVHVVLRRVLDTGVRWRCQRLGTPRLRRGLGLAVRHAGLTGTDGGSLRITPHQLRSPNPPATPA
ncbi:MAG: N-terminal phage integrase SAM-like domain-containing protein [Actinomycetota bacterium]|nr:N-terminal phage integrase SAM-like domain-containing protein [Actinomycetota bacterium]MDQ3680845.1 N-terminal phage integrase SAM-like domain-containing protein [Actinomycetota bacterium]